MSARLNRLKPPKLVRKGRKRYARPIPGDRSRWTFARSARGSTNTWRLTIARDQMVGLFPNRSAKSTLALLDQVVEEMPVSIQRTQTDCGQEFFAYRFSAGRAPGGRDAETLGVPHRRHAALALPVPTGAGAGALGP